jgi:hypothetical protein
VVEVACRVLVNIATHDALIDAVLAAGGVDAVMGVMATHASTLPAIAEQVCWCLRNLTSRPSGQALVSASLGLPPLFAVLAAHAAVPAVLVQVRCDGHYGLAYSRRPLRARILAMATTGSHTRDGHYRRALAYTRMPRLCRRTACSAT